MTYWNDIVNVAINIAIVANMALKHKKYYVLGLHDISHAII